jgi:hypothetical protein
MVLPDRIELSTPPLTNGVVYNSSSPSLTLIILSPIRKSIERGDFAASEIDVALVDFLRPFLVKCSGQHDVLWGMLAMIER